MKTADQLCFTIRVRVQIVVLSLIHVVLCHASVSCTSPGISDCSNAAAGMNAAQPEPLDEGGLYEPIDTPVE